MVIVHKKILINYSAEQMFKLVESVEAYPEFLPWCSGVHVKHRQKNNLLAKLKINYHGFTQSFTTENFNVPSKHITMSLVEGPFTQFEAYWNFKELFNQTSQIQFNMQYEFSNSFLDLMFGSVFNIIVNNLVNSFYKRAKQIYG